MGRVIILVEALRLDKTFFISVEANGMRLSVTMRHWAMELMKHVLPRLFKPQSSACT